MVMLRKRHTYKTRESEAKEDEEKENSEDSEPQHSGANAEFIAEIVNSLIEHLDSKIEHDPVKIPKPFNPKPKIHNCGKCAKNLSC